MQRTTTSAVAALALSLALAGCSGDAEPKAEPTPTPTASPSSLVGVPEGVTLTEEGTELGYGETATVPFAATQTLSTVLDLTVEQVRQGSVTDFKGFKLSAGDRKAAYFYADVSVKNLESGDLGGRAVPLFGMSDADLLLVPVTIQSAFTKCPSKSFPKVFDKGRAFKTCLVFQVPMGERFTGVAFRPVDSMDPILWTGELTVPKPKKRKPAPSATPSS